MNLLVFSIKQHVLSSGQPTLTLCCPAGGVTLIDDTLVVPGTVIAMEVII